MPDSRFPSPGIWIAICAAAAAWIASMILPHVLSDSLTDAGLIGDSFGVANSVLSSLALIGVVITLRLQHQDLEYQRQELRASTEALQGQLRAQSQSEKQLSRQAHLMQQTAILTSLNLVIENIDKDLAGIKRHNSRFAQLQKDKAAAIDRVHHYLETLSSDMDRTDD